MRVGVIGYNLIGKRVADAIVLQDDMELEGIVENNLLSKKTAKFKGFQVYDAVNKEFISYCDIIVNCINYKFSFDINTINIKNTSKISTLFSSLSNFQDVLHKKEIKIVEPNNIAISRIFYALSNKIKVNRLFGTIILRGAHATDLKNGPIDSLIPIFNRTDEQRELQILLGGNIDIFMRQVIAPYTNSNNVILKLSMEKTCKLNEIITLLKEAPRIIVAKGQDGFKDSAHIQEYYRDLGRPRFDRPEIFIWEESVIINENDLFMMVDVSPEATIIPDIIDAIRLNLTNNKIVNCISKTDISLGIKK